MNHSLEVAQSTVTNNAYTPNAQASLGSASAKQSLSETLALSKKAIAELKEARRVRPEQLNTPTRL